MLKIKMIFRVIRQMFRSILKDMRFWKDFERVIQNDLQYQAALNRFARAVGRTGFTYEQAKRGLLEWIRLGE